MAPGRRERFVRNSGNTDVSAKAMTAGKVEETMQKTAFHLFSRLPAELRAKIWAIALEDQKEQVPDYDSVVTGYGNSVIIHEHKEVDGKKQFSILSTRGYPTLFAVNREARYEAAKVDGGAWYTLGDEAPEVYVDLEKELVWFATCYHNQGWFKDTCIRSREFGIIGCDYLWHSQLKRKRDQGSHSLDSRQGA
ncbi:hypothetical protein GT037_002595 [Alternaria burnsii]|uniref:2EXR domain-containing protein n=1 Tax=Alternaria burnsii TaxID=1187904 RepID=A0A8H7EGA0_9PLEO|nr:uncharacterized protein GT037_002595 [Alternaria burnsii]KAF7678847.1 hypothetical protein GT037_002595 [Alternaria burnsii]